MEAPRIIMEITPLCTIKFIQSIHRILTCMTMNYIKYHKNTVAMSCINQLFQLVWITITTKNWKDTSFIDYLTIRQLAQNFYDVRVELSLDATVSSCATQFLSAIR